MHDDDMVQIHERHLSAPLGTDLVVLGFDTGSYYSTNAVGRQLWDRLRQPCRVGDLVNLVAAQFELPPEQARTDVHAFLDDLIRAGLARVVPAP